VTSLLGKKSVSWTLLLCAKEPTNASRRPAHVCDVSGISPIEKCVLVTSTECAVGSDCFLETALVHHMRYSASILSKTRIANSMGTLT
jgi:hypothetical protein